MQILLLTIILGTTVLDGLAELDLLPSVFKLVPEALSCLVFACVLFEGVRGGFRQIALKYWLAFGVTAFILLCSVLANAVGSGPMIAGARFYLRAIPMFFLAAVYPFTETQKLRQLQLLVAVCLLQLPVAAYQRWVVYSAGRFSGDSVVGTLVKSGPLSIFLICAILVLTGCYMRRRIRLPVFLTLFVLMVLPTTINETKATFLLLPVGLLTTLVIAAPSGKRARFAGWAVFLIAAFAAIMVPIYDLMEINNPDKKELISFFTDDKQLNGYLTTKNAGVGTHQQVGRTDALTIPANYLMRDPIHLAFGLGVGNASHSSLGENFVGQYYDLFAPFAITSFTIFLLEIGVLGCAMVFLLYWMVFSDAVAVAWRDRESLDGAIAAGWAGATVVMVISTFYTPTHFMAALSYLYWYFSGLLAVRRVQLAVPQPQAAFRLSGARRTRLHRPKPSAT